MPSAAAKPWNDPAAEPIIRIEDVSKAFDEVAVVQGVDLAIYQGEFFSLLGASGCGKTTLLRLLAGFETPNSGRIVIAGMDMDGVPPYRRPVNMMFQSYALFPHMTVAQNVAFGLWQDGTPRREIRARARSALELVEMQDFERRKPDELSGGQRQRVALARAIVQQPKLLLLDEPLAALDRKLRERTQLELVNIQKRVGITFVMVTHDQEEAMTMSTRIAVMNAGRIEQVGAPREIYEFPVTRFVADFIGAANLFEGVVTEAACGDVTVRLAGTGIEIHGIDLAPPSIGARVAVMVRPEKMTISRTPVPENSTERRNQLSGTVQDIAYLGDMSIYHVDIGAARPVQVSYTNLRHGGGSGISQGDPVLIEWHPGNGVVLTR